MTRRIPWPEVSKDPVPDWLGSWPEAEKAVQRAVRGRLPAGVEPEDVSQQVVVKLLRAGPEAPPPDRLRFWSVGVARRVVADLYRKKSIHYADLPGVPEGDVEAVVLTRLRCEAAAAAYSGLSSADREALKDSPDSNAMPNKTKLRRSRARRVLRQRAERLVGGGLLVPRWRWLTGALGAAAVAFPICSGGQSVPTSTPDRIDSVVVIAPRIQAYTEDLNPGSATRPEGTTARTGTGSPAAVAPEDKSYRRRVSVEIPVSGRTGYGHYDPAPGEPDPPLACARNLRVTDDVCVDHPLR